MPEMCDKRRLSVISEEPGVPGMPGIQGMPGVTIDKNA